MTPININMNNNNVNVRQTANGFLVEGNDKDGAWKQWVFEEQSDNSHYTAAHDKATDLIGYIQSKIQSAQDQIDSKLQIPA